MKRFPFAAAVILLLAAEAVHAVERAPPTIFSTSRRFAVTGLPPADAATLAAWADDVADKVEAATSSQIPFGAAEYISLRALAISNEAPRVTRAEGYLDGRLQQRLVLVNPAQVDQEDVLEGLCILLLDRQVAGHQSSAEKSIALARAPEWLPVGLAQNLYKELRARNNQTVLDLWDQDVRISLSRVTTLNMLPPGRWREKYFCGLAVGLLLTRPDYPQRWREMILQLARGEAVSADWLSAAYFEQKSRDELEPMWAKWIDAQRGVVFDFAGREQRQLEQLTTLLLIEPARLGIEVPKDVMVPLTPRALIQHRKEDWARALGAAAAMRIKLVGLGQAPEFQSIVAQYNAFFELLGSKKGARAEKELGAMVKGADEALAAYRSRRQSEQQYLNSVSRWHELDERAMSEARNAPALPEREQVEQYMDALERE